MFSCDDFSYLITFRSITAISIVTLLLIIFYRGTILWCIGVGLLFVTLYYLLRRFFGEDELYLSMDIKEIKNVKRLENTLEIIYEKWKALGSLPNLKKDVNFINFLFAIKPWAVYDQESYNKILRLVEKFLDLDATRATRVELRTNILDALEVFQKMKGYQETVTQFKLLAADFL